MRSLFIVLIAAALCGCEPRPASTARAPDKLASNSSGYVKAAPDDSTIRERTLRTIYQAIVAPGDDRSAVRAVLHDPPRVDTVLVPKDQLALGWEVAALDPGDTLVTWYYPGYAVTFQVHDADHVLRVRVNPTHPMVASHVAAFGTMPMGPEGHPLAPFGLTADPDTTTFSHAFSTDTMVSLIYLHGRLIGVQATRGFCGKEEYC